MSFSLQSLDVASSGQVLAQPTHDTRKSKRAQKAEQAEAVQGREGLQRDTLTTSGLFPPDGSVGPSASNKADSGNSIDQIIQQVSSLMQNAQNAPGDAGAKMLLKALGLIGKGVTMSQAGGMVAQLNTNKEALMMMGGQVIGMLAERGITADKANGGGQKATQPSFQVS